MYFGIPSFGLPDFGLPIFGIPSVTSVSTGTPNETDINFVFTILGDIDAITPDLYKYISDKYGLVYKNIQDSYNNINEAVTFIAKIDNVEAKLDLLKPLRQSSRTFQQNKYISQLYSATLKINNHVINRSEKTDLNIWLSENEIKVIPEWAFLCEETGITINSSNIQS